MEQRRLRLGDIVDDYCPRERRVTNHAVVAMIEEDIKQTRCTTCDAEHAYKAARVPKRRRKDAPAVPATAGASLSTDFVPSSESVARHESSEELEPPMYTDDTGRRPGPEPEPGPQERSREIAPLARPSFGEADREEPEEGGEVRPDAAPALDGPVHRRLIRATLPRPEGQKDTRPLPEFTVRQSPNRGNGQGHAQGGFRGERAWTRGASGGAEPNGNRAGGGSGQRVHGHRPGAGRQTAGRAGGSPGFRGSTGSKGKRGRGPRG